MYCLVENGVVTDGPRDLPDAWRNISGLKYTNDDAYLATLGWLPFVPVAAPMFDVNTHCCVSALVVDAAFVTQSWAVTPLDDATLMRRLLEEQSRVASGVRQQMNDLMIDEFIAAHPLEAAQCAAAIANNNTLPRRMIGDTP